MQRVPAADSDRFFTIFSTRNPQGKGRSVMLASSVLSTIITWLTTGMFYTGFLMVYGIDIVNVSILTFVPYIAACFGVLSPSILERIARRKAVLALARIVYYALNILGVTLLPVLVTDPGARIWLLVGIILCANIINALFQSGYTVWHLNFIPDAVRARYFGYQQLFNGFIGVGVTLISSIFTDALAGTPDQAVILIGLRYASFVIAAIDVILLCLPREYPYASSAKPRLRDIVTKPFGQKRFIKTMLVVFMVNFISNLSVGGYNYYLLNNIGVSYTYIQLVNMVWPFTMLFCVPICNRLLRKYGWFSCYGASLVTFMPLHICFAFLTPGNYLWLMTAGRILQHITGAPQNIINGNLVYINMPKEDQTNYSAFHMLVVNIAAFIGLASGTAFMAAFPTQTFTVLGFPMVHVQVLLLIQGIGGALVGLLVLKMRHALTPEQA